MTHKITDNAFTLTNNTRLSDTRCLKYTEDSGQIRSLRRQYLFAILVIGMLVAQTQGLAVIRKTRGTLLSAIV
jgi:hypothetical protein